MSETQNDGPDGWKYDGSLWFLAALLLLVVAMWAAWPFLAQKLALWQWAKSDPPDLGLYGDQFGGINALFTAAALAVLLWAGWMQRADLQHQRKEFAEQRLETRNGQAVVARQAFEATFFRMLELQRGLHDRISFLGRHAGDAVLMISNKIKQNTESLSPTDVFKFEIGQHFEHQIYVYSKDSLGPYFRSLYHLFKLINDTEALEEQDRIRFANIVRSQLSDSVLVMIAANGCNDEMASGMRPLTIKYRLLKHMEREGLFGARVESCYPPETFLDR
ncbi:hypothetical protein SLNSH_17070 [Alsobacter soli]|uniref:Uncharacterized protein n=1 Tax=Alsobacter soli TaxID=2109933 RepID=A0A2T1HQ91_9HYPH|nr:putative phage abortive infection protein [Alsobacter soli]PSC03820.1 hypothetical protein SLNSH_17070 [Alsobacter soli]